MVALAPATSRADEHSKKTETPPSSRELMTMQSTAPKDGTEPIDSDRSGYLTREEFMNLYQALVDRLDRNANAQVEQAPPQFTDAG